MVVKKTSKSRTHLPLWPALASAGERERRAGESHLPPLFLPSVIAGILSQAGLQLPEDSHKPPFADSGRVSRLHHQGFDRGPL